MEGDGEVKKTCLSSFIDEGSTESHRYFLSRRTLLEMLKDRGFVIPESEINLSLAEFRAIHGQTPDTDRLRISATHQSDPSKKVLLIFFRIIGSICNLFLGIQSFLDMHAVLLFICLMSFWGKFFLFFLKDLIFIQYRLERLFLYAHFCVNYFQVFKDLIFIWYRLASVWVSVLVLQFICFLCWVSFCFFDFVLIHQVQFKQLLSMSIWWMLLDSACAILELNVFD